MTINKETLAKLLKDSGSDIDSSSVDYNENFSKMGLDSLDLFNFFSELDIQYGIEISDEDYDQLNTLEEVFQYVSKL